MFKINNMGSEDYKKIEDLNKKLKSDPSNIDLLMQRAFVYFKGYDDKNAIEAYKEIIKKFPKYINAYLFLSYYLYQISCNIPEAIKVAKKGLKLDPYNAGFYTIIAFATAFYDYADEKEFLHNVKKAIELEPTWIWPRISLISYLRKNKKFEDEKKEIYNAKKQIQDDFPVPQNDMERFYEYSITGRAGARENIETLNFFNKIPEN